MKKSNITKVEFFRHNIDERDIDNVNAVLRSIFLTTGSVVETFENSFASYLSVKNVVGMTSCTAGLHLCLIAWNIGEGDEVITTPMTFCATANAILHAGATPVFVDVEENTGNIDAELIEARITENTKAIIPVHLYGQMCDMKRIKEIADKYRLVIVEDAAHCIEGMRDGVRVGELGDAACFSFYATKSITSGEGGAVATNYSEKAELLKMLRLHGIDKDAAHRYTKRYQHWDMRVLGWKYNMDNIQAALLLKQLEKIEKLLESRELIWQRYERSLSDLNGIELLKTIPNSKHTRHLFTIIVELKKRDSILCSLQERGVGVAVNYRAIHLLEYYRDKLGYKEGDFPRAERIGAGTISLPLYPLMKDSEVEYVIRNVIELITQTNR